MFQVTVLPEGRIIAASDGEVLLNVLRRNGVWIDAPCGGTGKCGKCTAFVDGEKVKSCDIRIHKDLTVALCETGSLHILNSGTEGDVHFSPISEGYLAAFDIGTTSLVCFLMDPNEGRQIGCRSTINPQRAYGADVISRIHSALQGTMDQQTAAIRTAMEQLLRDVCTDAGITPEAIGVVSVVGNPAMQQIFMGIPPRNLAEVPFAPALRKAEIVPCYPLLPCCPAAMLTVIPDISGYVGADTVGCILSSGIFRKDELTLLVDIGTNGEMVLGNKERMIACSTAAGPALEGANIQFGMRAAEGAIDHVWLENGAIRCSVIGGGVPKGICGSGLIDAVAVALDAGLINKRGRIQNEERIIPLAENVYLTQDDIRQVQLAKGAVRAGIELMMKEMEVRSDDVCHLLLAGAFGNYLNPESACRIGLLPEEMILKIRPVGNAAGSGAKMLAKDNNLLFFIEELIATIQFLELADLQDFPKTFAKSMNFREVDP